MASALASINKNTYGVPTFTAEDNRKAFARYDAVEGSFDKNVLDKAASWAYRVWVSYMRRPQATHEEVIANFDWSTSPGYPYTLMWSSKRDVFLQYGSDWLRNSYDYWIKTPYQGLFKNFLKEEVRQRGKDTRGILAGPLDISYIMARLFLAQNEGFYSSYLKTPSAVGISRDGLEWNMLFRKLFKYDIGSDIDIKKFDSKMLEVLMLTLCELRKAFLTEDQADLKPAFDAAYDILINTLCIVEGEVLQKRGGNPTGSVNTVVDNTLVLFIIMAYAFIILNPGATLHDFLTKVMMAMYGDDFTNTHSKEVNFHPDAISKVLKEAFGYECVHDGEKSVMELTFLSAFFKKEMFSGMEFAVPLFDQEKMASHAIYGQKKDPHKEFQRIASLRNINCFDTHLVAKFDEWLVAHRHFVTPQEFEQWVMPINLVRKPYFFPKKKEPILYAQSGRGPLFMVITNRFWDDTVQHRARYLWLRTQAQNKLWCMALAESVSEFPNDTNLQLALFQAYITQLEFHCRYHENMPKNENCRYCMQPTESILLAQSKGRHLISKPPLKTAYAMSQSSLLPFLDPKLPSSDPEKLRSKKTRLQVRSVSLLLLRLIHDMLNRLLKLIV